MAMDDAERPLAERGHGESRQISAFMQQQKIVPDIILCSTARRTRETLDGLHAGGVEAVVSYEDGLYLASAGQLLARLSQLEDSVQHVLVIGHNPGLHQLAGQLAVEGEMQAARDLVMQFPPCALACIECAHDVTLGGKLRHFITPKMLD